jgi:4a-hydroxytetrahydrobiopterin dehydratase
MAGMTTLSGPQIADEGLDGWAYLLGGLQTRIRTPDFATGLAVVAAIGAAAQEAGRHLDVDLRHDHVDVRVAGPGARGMTGRDVALARDVSAVAADAGLVTESSTVSRIEFAVDTPAVAAVRPFWAAVLAVGDPGADDEVRDPAGALPTVWFQPSGGEEPRQRWHPDVWVEPDGVRPRIDAALAAGGTLVSDAEAPSFWVLADPEGNRVCLCTWQERDGGDS